MEGAGEEETSTMPSHTHGFTMPSHTHGFTMPSHTQRDHAITHATRPCHHTPAVVSANVLEQCLEGVIAVTLPGG